MRPLYMGICMQQYVQSVTCLWTELCQSYFNYDVLELISCSMVDTTTIV